MVEAYELIKSAKKLVIFTGAGISVESGIRPFRGPGGLYEKYDKNLFDRNWYCCNTAKAVEVYNDIFFTKKYEPNEAHRIIPRLNPSSVITMNIDLLHEKGGSDRVIHLHGDLDNMQCIKCHKLYPIEGKIDRVKCDCGRLLKPTIIMFGDNLNKKLLSEAQYETYYADVIIAIGSTGEVFPACDLVYEAQANGAKLIEINIEESKFSPDYFLKGRASDVLREIESYVND